MASPLAFQRAFYFARGVSYQTHGLQERFLKDYFDLERLLRYYETKMNLVAIRSISVPEELQKLNELEQAYVEALFPEEIGKRDNFINRGVSLLEKYTGKKFMFSGDHRQGFSLKGITESDMLEKRFDNLPQR